MAWSSMADMPKPPRARREGQRQGVQQLQQGAYRTVSTVSARCQMRGQPCHALSRACKLRLAQLHIAGIRPPCVSAMHV
eukprot:5597663-Prymnesium_polylepis.3